jgi:hypothetical protein
MFGPDIVHLFRERRGRGGLAGESRHERRFSRAKRKRLRGTTAYYRNTGGNLIDRHHVVLLRIFR